MLAEQRMEHIVDLVNERGSVTAAELMEQLNASESTIRRDLTRLDEAGRVVRVHGGATAALKAVVSSDRPLSERHVTHAAEKDAIGRAAAALIGPHDFVYIDAGTTTMALVSHITETRATYVTNALSIARLLMERGCRVYMLGGMLKPLTEAMVGEQAIESARRYHFTLGFFGANGIMPDAGFTTPEVDEAAIKRAVIGQTLRPFVLCDASKFFVVSPVTFASFNDATIITNEVPQEFAGTPNVVAARTAAQERADALQFVPLSENRSSSAT